MGSTISGKSRNNLKEERGGKAEKSGGAIGTTEGGMARKDKNKLDTANIDE